MNNAAALSVAQRRKQAALAALCALQDVLKCIEVLMLAEEVVREVPTSKAASTHPHVTMHLPQLNHGWAIVNFLPAGIGCMLSSTCSMFVIVLLAQAV